MNLRVGCELEYDAEADAHAVVLVEPHSSIQDTIVEEHWSPSPRRCGSATSTATSAGASI